jgi:hypothetical protein
VWHFRYAEPQVAPQATRSPWGAGPMRKQCGPRSQVSRRCRTPPGHNRWAVCSAVRPNVLRPCCPLRCLFASHLSNLCSLATVVWSVRRPCAHVERSTHACSVPRFEVATRSESVASVRFRSCSCDRAQLVSRIFGGERRALGGRVQKSGPLSSHVMFLGFED